MLPVKQTRVGFGEGNEPPGNCWAACIASIFEVNLEELPDEAKHWTKGCKPEDSWESHEREVLDWLKEKGYVLVTVRCHQLFVNGQGWRFNDCYNILSGPSPRNPALQHAVVGKGNKIVHDPHPSNDGLAGDPDKDWYYEFFLPINLGEQCHSRQDTILRRTSG